MATEVGLVSSPRRARAHGVVGVALAVVIAAGLLLWAKWFPYSAKVQGLASSRHWGGHSTLSSAGIKAGAAPSWHGAWSFTVDYGLAVWKALVAALVIAAAMQSLVPRGWLVGLLSRRRPVTSAMTGGLASMPSMMCTCCTAPVAVSLRRCGAPTSAVLAYWMGNPLLNPAVLVFLALVAPWQWVATRAVVGVALVVVGSTLIARFAKRRSLDDDAVPNATTTAPETFDLSASPARFAKALLRLTLILVPEYFVVVLLIGAFGGWLFPLSNGSGNQAMALAAALILGTLLVIPTAGEIPLAQGLSVAGAGLGVVGALLVTLPAVSLPSLVMVGRALTWRVTIAAAGAVAIAGGVAAVLLSALG
jgi:uncharacterized membrane protein YraQ (UPF0718 family)